MLVSWQLYYLWCWFVVIVIAIISSIIVTSIIIIIINGAISMRITISGEIIIGCMYIIIIIIIIIIIVTIIITMDTYDELFYDLPWKLEQWAPHIEKCFNKYSTGVMPGQNVQHIQKKIYFVVRATGLNP